MGAEIPCPLLLVQLERAGDEARDSNQLTLPAARRCLQVAAPLGLKELSPLVTRSWTLGLDLTIMRGLRGGVVGS